MEDINDLQYFRTIIFANVTGGLYQEKEKFLDPQIGEGGFLNAR